MPGVVLCWGREFGREEVEESSWVSGVLSGGNICHTVEAPTDVGRGQGCSLEESQSDGEGSKDPGSSRAG